MGIGLRALEGLDRRGDLAGLELQHTEVVSQRQVGGVRVGQALDLLHLKRIALDFQFAGIALAGLFNPPVELQQFRVHDSPVHGGVGAQVGLVEPLVVAD